MQSVFWDLLILMTVALTAAVLLGRICVPRIILQLPDEQKAEDDQQEPLEAERCRVATLQIRVAGELAEMQRKGRPSC